MRTVASSFLLAGVFALAASGTSRAGNLSASKTGGEPIQLAQAGEAANPAQLQQELNETQQRLDKLRAEEQQERQAAQAKGKPLYARPAFRTARESLEKAAEAIRNEKSSSWYHGTRQRAMIHINKALYWVGMSEKIDRQHGCCAN